MCVHGVGVGIRGSICAGLWTACVYDQLQANNLAVFESKVLELQMVEERWKDKITGHIADDGDINPSLFLRDRNRPNLCTCPALQTYLAEEVRQDTAVAKERKKAREQRALLKPKSKAKGGGDG